MPFIFPFLIYNIITNDFFYWRKESKIVTKCLVSDENFQTDLYLLWNAITLNFILHIICLLCYCKICQQMHIPVLTLTLISWRDSWLSSSRITWLWRIVLLTTRGDKAWVIVVALVYTKTNRGPDSGIYLHHVPYGNGASMV